MLICTFTSIHIRVIRRVLPFSFHTHILERAVHHETMKRRLTVIVTIILQCEDGVWNYQTFGQGELLNFGTGYLTPELALIQAQIFTKTLPDGTVFAPTRYHHVHQRKENPDGETRDYKKGYDGQGPFGPQAGS